MLQLTVNESFTWAQQLLPILKQFESDGVSFYECVASTADVKNRNGRVYTSLELSRAAASLSERPLNINHDPRRTLGYPENQVLVARFENGILEAIIQVADRQISRMIDSGEISAVSVEGTYLDGSKNSAGTEYPTSLHFSALALLTQGDTPSDPNARIIRESMANRIAGLIAAKLVQEKAVPRVGYLITSSDFVPVSFTVGDVRKL